MHHVRRYHDRGLLGGPKQAQPPLGQAGQVGVLLLEVRDPPLEEGESPLPPEPAGRGPGVPPLPLVHLPGTFAMRGFLATGRHVPASPALQERRMLQFTPETLTQDA